MAEEIKDDNRFRFYCASDELAEYLEQNHITSTRIGFLDTELYVGDFQLVIDTPPYAFSNNPLTLRQMMDDNIGQYIVVADVSTMERTDDEPTECLIENIWIKFMFVPANLEVPSSNK